ncbi:MAG TPA: hypothetical protein VF625_10820 [Longimicrobium sp.]
MTRRILLAAALLACAAPAAAQSTPAPARPDSASLVRTQAISILPIHFLFGWYAGDYERVLTRTTTLGFGASHFTFGGWDDGYDDGYVDGDGVVIDEGDGDFRYISADAKLRYYPSGDALDGLSFGVTAGPTWVRTDLDTDDGDTYTAIGLGFEVARSNTLGIDRRFYYGIGAGAKRLFPISDGEDDSPHVIPTLRFSVGLLF